MSVDDLSDDDLHRMFAEQRRERGYPERIPASRESLRRLGRLLATPQRDNRHEKFINNAVGK